MGMRFDQRCTVVPTSRPSPHFSLRLEHFTCACFFVRKSFLDFAYTCTGADKACGENSEDIGPPRIPTLFALGFSSFYVFHEFSMHLSFVAVTSQLQSLAMTCNAEVQWNIVGALALDPPPLFAPAV